MSAHSTTSVETYPRIGRLFTDCVVYPLLLLGVLHPVSLLAGVTYLSAIVGLLAVATGTLVVLLATVGRESEGDDLLRRSGARYLRTDCEVSLLGRSFVVAWGVVVFGFAVLVALAGT